MKKLYGLLIIVLVTASASAQFELIKDIYPGTDSDGNPNSSFPANMTAFNNAIYFAAKFDGNYFLYKTDGTTEGTKVVKDLSGIATATPTDFIVYNNQLHFSVNHSSNGDEAWITDGTEQGTVSLNINHRMYKPFEIDGLMYYFKKIAPSNPLTLYSLYQWDGTESTSVLNTNQVTEQVSGGKAISLNGKILLYMKGADTSAEDLSLYSYDPATGIYTLLKEFRDGQSGSIQNFTQLNGKAYFGAYYQWDVNGTMLTKVILWESDGTPQGTIPVAATAANDMTSFIEYPKSVYAWNDMVFFEGDYFGTDNLFADKDQLFAYLPSTGELKQLTALEDGGVAKDHDPNGFCPSGDWLYYKGKTASSTAYHLWRTNGIVAELLATDINQVDDIAVFQGGLIMEGTDNDIYGKELFKYGSISTGLDTGIRLAPMDVYPNPSEGIIYIKGLENDDATYELFNLAGSLIRSGKSVGNRVTLGVKPGIYIMTLKTTTQSQSFRVVIK